jgi:hypothetical protein
LIFLGLAMGDYDGKEEEESNGYEMGFRFEVERVG